MGDGKVDGRVVFGSCDVDVKDAFIFDMVYTRVDPPVVTKDIYIEFYLEGIIVQDGYLNYT